RETQRMKSWRSAVALLLACGPALTAAEPAAVVRFEREVQPLLARCVACHSPGKARGGLRLDNRQGATAVLKSGNRAVVPGHPEESELLRRVAAADPDERMPPKGDSLKAAAVEQLRRWIADGAVWPAHWAYRPLVKPPLPRPHGQ